MLGACCDLEEGFELESCMCWQATSAGQHPLLLRSAAIPGIDDRALVD